jgi:acetyl esterase/lipase
MIRFVKLVKDARRLLSASFLSVALAAGSSHAGGTSTEAESGHAMKQEPKQKSKYPPLVLPDGVKMVKDIAFGRGGGRDLLGDLFLPKDSTSDRPIHAMVYIHGGAWRKGDKSLRHRTAARFAQIGIAGLSIDYRLSQEAIFPAQIHDCKAAIRWVRANAERLNIDPDRIGVLGASAGAHLSAFIATTSRNREYEGNGGNPDFSSAVQFAVLFYGVFDLTRFGKRELAKGGDIARQLTGGTVEEMPDAYQEASPLTHVSAETPPCLLIHGGADSIVPLEQSEIFLKALRDSGVEAELFVEEGKDHAYDLYAEDLNPLLAPVERFVDKQFGLNKTK